MNEAKNAHDFYPNSSDEWAKVLVLEINSKSEVIAQKVLIAIGINDNSKDIPRESLQTDVKLTEVEVEKGAEHKKLKNAIVSIDNIENIRALQNPVNPIILAPFITVFYGRNASGKSSIAQAIKVFSGSYKDIPPGLASEDKNLDKSADQRKVNITVSNFATYIQHPNSSNFSSEKIEWVSDKKDNPVISIEVVDKSLIDNKSDLEPWKTESVLGIDAFDRAREALEIISEKITEVIKKNDVEIADLLEGNTEDEFIKAKQLIDSIDNGNTLEDVEVLKNNEFELNNAISNIRNASINQEQNRRNKAKFEGELKAIEQLLASGFSKNEVFIKFESLDEIIKQKTIGFSEVFKELSFNVINREDWQKFIEAGDEFLNKEFSDKSYLSDSNVCYYCGQTLTDRAIEFITKIKGRLKSSLTEQEQHLKKEINKVKDCFVELKGYDGIPIVENSGIFSKEILEGYFADLPSLKNKIVKKVTECDQLLTHLSDPNAKNDELLHQTNRLNEIRIKILVINKGSAIRKWASIRYSNARLNDIQNKLTNLKSEWAKNRTKAIQELGMQEFRDNFNIECKKLSLPENLRLRPGTDPSGKAQRKTTIKGKKPAIIFSESERTAWVIADTLAEIKTLKKNSILLLDDPVNSMDIERINQLSRRIIEEAKVRQVIIFTHNRYFLLKLKQAIRDTYNGQDTKVKGYTIERWQDTTGLVIEFDLFKDDVEKIIDHIENLITKPTLVEIEIASGFLAVRRVIEIIIDKYVLKGFRSKLNPEMTNIEWGNLKKIQVEETLVNDLQELFSYISDLGDLHLTQTSSLQMPTKQDLKNAFDKIKSILEQLKDTKNQSKLAQGGSNQ